MLAERFAISLDQEFRKRARRGPVNEEILFGKLRQSFLALSNKFHVEEYHGRNHQVKFNGLGSWGRGSKARCELSDLLIVTFSKSPKLDIRLTFLQAKYEKQSIFKKPQISFAANLEQWDLLSSRPPITGIRNFKPPKNLLSGALLPSVGTFGFFYKQKQDFQIFYCIANRLKPSSYNYRQRKGRLHLAYPIYRNRVNNQHGYKECQVAPCTQYFAYQLYQGHIGTPINTVPGAHNLRVWLGGVLSSLIYEPHAEGERVLVRELLSSLDVDRRPGGMHSFGTKSLIIIKRDTEES